MWYNQIHAYKNIGNIIQFTRCTNIKDPDKQTMEELKDGLRYCRIWKAELRKQAKGLRKVYLRDCLIDAQTKKQYRLARDIKQTINREESRQMWCLIKRTV